MLQKDLISIVVPVYNVQDYIVQCIGSLINQTYRNLEIIIIDDGSTDKSGAICDSFAVKDSRIVVKHIENCGLSEARNTGIRIAKGTYICFVDSDDYVSIDYVQRLYDAINKYNADISVCTMARVSGNRKKTRELGTEGYFTKNEMFELVFTEYTFVGVYAWNKMYKAALFTNVLYPKGMHFEDSGTTYKLIEKCDRCAFVDEPLYIYRVARPGQITNTKLDYFLDKETFLTEMEEFFQNNNSAVLYSFYTYYVFSLLNILERCALSEYMMSDLARSADIALKRLLSKYNMSYLPMKLRIKSLMYLRSEFVFRNVCRIKNQIK